MAGSYPIAWQATELQLRLTVAWQVARLQLVSTETKVLTRGQARQDEQGDGSA